MAKEYDLVIRNGTVVDGTGAAPREADVAVRDGRIAAVGKVAGAGAEEIDAKGRIVTPGFVDIHTHYDGQATWDRALAPSSWHGVTTAVMGNCGVGFAPCKPDGPRQADRADGRRRGHSRSRHERGPHVELGELPRVPRRAREQRRSTSTSARCCRTRRPRLRDGRARRNRHEPATEADIAADARARRGSGRGRRLRLLDLAHASATRASTGEYTPTLRANEDELAGIAMGSRMPARLHRIRLRLGRPDPKSEFDMLRRVAEQRAAARVLGQPATRAGARKPVEGADRLFRPGEADGLSMRPVTAPRAVGVLLGLEGSQNPFSGTPTYKSIAPLPRAERVEAHAATRQVRAKILSEDPIAGATWPLIRRLQYTHMYPLRQSAQLHAEEGGIDRGDGRAPGRHAAELAYDILIEDDGRNFILSPLSNYPDFSLEGTAQMLSNRNVIAGLGDGGAHVGFIVRRRLFDLAPDLLGPRAEALADRGDRAASHVRHGWCSGPR